MRTVAGVDLGGTGSRMAIAGETSGQERRKTFGRSFISPDSMGDAILSALTGFAGDDLAAACVGTTGMPGLLTDAGDLAAKLFAHTSLEAVVVAGDCVTTHVGALGFQPGAVVAAGTGSIALGTDFDDVWNRVDGWGYLLGDAGSGAWVGRRGLAAALESLDGRGGSARLLRMLTEQFGDPDALLQTVYRQGAPGAAAARFAPAVEAAAHGGDPAARAIWVEAGQHLARSAIAACRNLPPVVSWGGGLFSAGPLLLDPFIAELSALRPDIAASPPIGTALDGAISIARAYLGGRTLATNEFHQVFVRGEA